MSQKNNELPAPRLTASSAERARKERGPKAATPEKSPTLAPLENSTGKKRNFHERIIGGAAINALLHLGSAFSTELGISLVPIHKRLFLLVEVGRIGAEGGRARGHSTAFLVGAGLLSLGERKSSDG